MAAGELAVPIDPGVRDVPVEYRGQLDTARPVLGVDCRLQSAHVRHVHRHETTLPEPGRASLGVAEPDVADQDRPTQVEGLTEPPQELDRVDVEPVSVVDPEGERQPVGQVDQALVLHHPAGSSSLSRL